MGEVDFHCIGRENLNREDDFNHQFSYLYPTLVADLLENWHLPLTDFMQRVQTYYGQATRQRLDVDSVVTRQTLRVAEWHLYGSSRLGIYKTQDTLRTVDLSLVYKLSDVNIAPTQTLSKKEFYSFDSAYTHKRGDKLYEGSNHLGNVLATFSDKRLAECFEGSVHYQADVRSATDYAAFHSQLDDRQWYSSTDSAFYRYGGSNGQEKDDEIYGTGNSYSAEFWQYDPRLARRWNVDPVAAEREWLAPYQTFGLDPINRIDPSGAIDHEWRYNTTTQSLEKVGEEGGNEHQYVYFTKQNENGDLISLGSKVISGSEVFVGPVRGGNAAANFDLWYNIPSNYNSQSWDYNLQQPYEYSLLDLRKRFEIFSKSIESYQDIISGWESTGRAQPIHIIEFNRQYQARWGANSAFWYGAEHYMPYVLVGGSVQGGAQLGSSAARVASAMKQNLTNFGTRGASSNVQKVLNTMDQIKKQGGTITSNKLAPNQEINLTFHKGSQKLDFRTETHPVRNRYGGNGSTPQRHMNFDL